LRIAPRELLLARVSLGHRYVLTPIISTTILRTQSDDRLVALARDGHARAFEALVER